MSNVDLILENRSRIRNVLMVHFASHTVHVIRLYCFNKEGRKEEGKTAGNDPHIK